MGNGVVESLKQEFDIEDTWVSYEIHPETPAAGMPLGERFPMEQVERMYEQLRSVGAQYGIVFGRPERLSNSRLALEASEFARDNGQYHAFHKRVFEAYFTHGKDIGDMEVVLSTAADVGLHVASLKRALEQGDYSQRLQDALVEGRRYGVTGTPTFIVNNRYKIVGAQPIDVFRNALRQIQSEESGNQEG